MRLLRFADPTSTGRRLVVSLLALLAVLSAWPAPVAAAATVPEQTQLALTLRILTYDRNLATRAGKEVVLGIVYQGKLRESLLVEQGIEAAAQAQPMAGTVPLRVVAIDLDREADLTHRLTTDAVHVLYVAPLRAVAPETVIAAARQAQAMTVTACETFSDAPFSVFLEQRGGRPSFRLDLFAAREEGVDFHPDLYKVASAVKGRGQV
jgi:hypothetical protein